MTLSRSTPDEPEAHFARQLGLAREGCAESLGDLLQGCRRYLLLAANRGLESTLRPKEGASDLVQATFLLAQRDFFAFRGQTMGELLGWLNRILEHQLSNNVRYYKAAARRTVRRETSLDAGVSVEHLQVVDAQPRPAEVAAKSEERRQVQEAISRLPEHYQTMLELRAWQRWPFAKIARQMNLTTGAAEKLWLRAVEHLQTELGSSYER